MRWFWIWRFSNRNSAGLGVVGQNAADAGGGDEDILGLFCGEEMGDGGGVPQVQFGVGFANQVGKAAAEQFAPQGAADHAAMACDVNWGFSMHHMGILNCAA